LNSAKEIQFTHTNFDFDAFTQPESAYQTSKFNQPNLPSGYAIFYPVKTKKNISISNIPYESNRIFVAEIGSFSQIEVVSVQGNLPSRFVGASVGKWKDSKVESECSTGIFIQDYLNVQCHWHWGLLKPGFEFGFSNISIHVNNFNSKKPSARKLNLKLYDNSGLILNNFFIILKSKLLKDFMPAHTIGSVWYVISGENLEDLHIFSTFFPLNKSGFVEHSF
jgi:hypothetical protein